MTDETFDDDGWIDDIEINTTVRRTSIEAYRRIKKEGLLTKAGFTVYDRLCRATRFDGEPITAGELKQFVRNVYGLTHVDGYHKRLSELRDDYGVVREGAARKCRATGFKATTWISNGSLPVESKKLASMPPKADLRAAAAQFKHWRNRAILNNEPVPDAVDVTIAWLVRRGG